ncbi:MAG: HAMP domain-containing histidine kinase [Bacteroidetes bacterium]|nr:HAMP domain-containing histidine kinase [Bacteroidota bacterium]
MSLNKEISELELAKEVSRLVHIKEKELADLKSNFVSMVSHEFRTPLTTILSYTQILQNYRNKLTDEDQDKYLKNIELAVARMTTMLNDVLSLGKSNSGVLKVTTKAVNLLELCQSIVEELILLDSSKHSFVFNFDYQNSTINTDEKLLKQILFNLLTNSLKYSQEGTTVELTVSSVGTSILFEVKDNGIGIPKEYFSSMFESFRRADNVGNISGTGLGLTIVKQSVDLLGGTISVESTENKGTTFRVELPLT